MTARIWTASLLVRAALCARPSLADATAARCDIYPSGSDQLDKMAPCTFSQRQGYVTIAHESSRRNHATGPAGAR